MNEHAHHGSIDMGKHSHRIASQRNAGSLAFLALVFCASAAQARFPTDRTRHVDVLGTSVRVLEIGLDERRAGSPVIVLDSGGAEPLEQWRDWPVLLSKMAPVVAYDRAGLGESEWDGALPTPEHVAERLHALLAKIAVPPPYILVGHSLGTDLIPGYTAAYPEEVVGEVHLDPTPELRPDVVFGTEDPATLAARRAEYDSLMDAQPASASEGVRAESRLMREYTDGRRARTAILPASDLPTAVVLAASVPGQLPPGLPSYVTRDRLTSAQNYKVSFFVEAMRRRPRGTILIANDSDHFVFWNDPLLSAEAVRRVIAAAANRQRERQ